LILAQAGAEPPCFEAAIHKLLAREAATSLSGAYKDWHRDFTVLVDLKHNDALKAAGVAAKALAGKRLRVRVWIEWRNGPMIDVTHVEQIEILPDAGITTAQTPETQPSGAIAL